MGESQEHNAKLKKSGKTIRFYLHAILEQLKLTY